MATDVTYRNHFRVLPEHEWPDEYEQEPGSSNREPTWYARERARFSQPKDGGTGEPAYRQLPAGEWSTLVDFWGAGAIMGHFAHYSVNHPGMIAFTKSFAHGVADRQTVMKPGRYLSTYFADSLSAPGIARLAGQISALAKPPEVHFARTAEDIRRVYRNGPSSCMAYRETEYSTGGIHPTAVYAGPDTAVAYMLSNADDPDSVTARSVVKMEGDQPVAYTRVYGDADRLVEGLRGMGLSQRMTLDGVRLPRIPVPGRDGTFVMPYLDNLSDRGWIAVAPDPSDPGYFMVHHVTHEPPSGAVGTSNTCGAITFHPQHECEYCGDEHSARDMARIDGELYCSECREEHFRWSDAASRYVLFYDATVVQDRFGSVEDHIPYDWVGTRGYERCALSGDVYHTRHMTEVVLHDDFRPTVRPADLALSWVADHVLEGRDDEYVQCPETGFWLHVDHMVEIEDETVDGGSLWYAPWADRVREYEQSLAQDPYYIQGRDEHPDQIELALPYDGRVHDNIYLRNAA